MTAEERRKKRLEYQRNWNRQNKDKVKEYKKDAAIRRAIRDINNGVVTMKKVMVMEHDEGYTAQD